MKPVKFMAYGISAPGYPGAIGPVPFDHAFVVSERGDNWNCWGRGQEGIAMGARHLMPDGLALAEWGALVNGPDPGHVAGLTLQFDGVCQTAANRILVLAGTDVSAANGNIFATMLYGKYGFNVEGFVARIKQTADQLNQQEAGAVSEAALQEVLTRIADDPSEELAILESHFQDALPQTLPPQQNSQLMEIYRAFQARRVEVYEKVAPPRGGADFQMRFARDLGPAFLDCLSKMTEVLGGDKYKEVFKASPQEIIQHLLKV